MSKNYTMSYEPEPNKGGKFQEPEFCVWHDKDGKEVLRMKYQSISDFRAIWGVPSEISEEIIFWTKMLYNPD